MIRQRHSRGRVIDLNSEVCPDSHLDNTTVANVCDVYHSNLKDSWVDESKIVRSWITKGDIQRSTVIFSPVDDSNVYDSEVYDSQVSGSHIENANLRGAIIRASVITDGWITNATLDGVHVDKPVRIGTGHWTRCPRSFEINNDITRSVVVTESTDGCAYVGCVRKPIERWDKGRYRYAKAMGWSKETADAIVERMKEWLD